MTTKTFKVSLSLDNPRIIQSGIDVRSFDKQSIKIAIELIKNSQVYQIPAGAQIKISLLKLARQEQKMILDVPNTNRDSIDWIVPDYLDGYQGTVRVGIYLIVGGENVDVGYFNITSSVSDIDNAAGEFTESVMQGWDQIEADLAEIRATITRVDTLASDFTDDVATKQSDVTSKYDAFDTSVTTANQTIDDILGLADDVQQVSAQLEDYTTQRQQDNLKIATVEKGLNDYKSTMASVNVNQEAKQKVAGYGVVSLPKNTANGQVSSIWVKGLSDTNLVDQGGIYSTLSNDSGNGVAEGFTSGMDATVTAIYSIDNSQQKIDITTTSLSARSAWVQRFIDNIFGGDTLSLRLEGYIKGGVGFKGLVELRFLDINNAFISTHNIEFVNTSLSEIKSENISVPTNTIKVRVQVKAITPNDTVFGSVWVKNIKINKNSKSGNFITGTKSTISASRLKSINKNLITGFKLFTNLSNTFTAIDNQNAEIIFGGESSSNRSVASPIIPITDKAVSAQIDIASNTLNTNFRLKMTPTDSLGNVLDTTGQYSIISPGSIGVIKLEDKNLKVLYPNATHFRYELLTDGGTQGKVVIRNPSVEYNTVATAYEPHTSSASYLPNVGELRSLPNGTKDEVRVSGGKAEYIKRVSDEVTLNHMRNWQLSGIQYDGLIRLYTTSIQDELPNYNLGGGVNLEGMTFTGIKPANVNKINSFSLYSAAGISILFGLDKISTGLGDNPTLTQIQNYFTTNPITLTYQLAEPIITPIQTSGNLISYPSGTVYVEPVTNVAGIYKDKISVLTTGLPIQSIDKISKIDFTTGNETLLDVSKAVIASDKLSFTHPNLTSGDIVFFEYYYPQDITTIGNMEVEYLDSRYTLKDSVTSKFYKWEISVANGIPSINLVEVL